MYHCTYTHVNGLHVSVPTALVLMQQIYSTRPQTCTVHPTVRQMPQKDLEVGAPAPQSLVNERKVLTKKNMSILKGHYAQFKNDEGLKTDISPNTPVANEHMKRYSALFIIR